MFQYKIVFLLLIFFSCNNIQLKRNTVYAQTLNVKDFGAKGNSVTDDTKVFQKIFNQVKPGQKIYIPTGKYIISEPLLIKVNNIQIEGDGISSQLIFNNKKDYYQLYGLRVGIINIISSQVKLKKIYLDQNFRNSRRQDGDKPLIGGVVIGGKYLGKAQFVSNIIIDNIHVYDYYGDAISVFSSKIENLEVKNCHLTSSYIAGNWKKAGSKGEQGISVASGKNIIIEHNAILGALDDAIAVHRNNQNVKIIDNHITTTGGRILINGTKDGLVENNYIEYIQDGGCAIQISFDSRSRVLSVNDNILINNNTILINDEVKIKAAIQIFGGGKNITLESNKLRGNGLGTAILVQDRNSKQLQKKVHSENIILKYNKIENFKNNKVFHNSKR